MTKVSDSASNSNELTEENKINKKKEDNEWSNPIEFLMTCIGFAVGLGNIWRFP